jgi:hypothetical protein
MPALRHIDESGYGIVSQDAVTVLLPITGALGGRAVLSWVRWE